MVRKGRRGAEREGREMRWTMMHSWNRATDWLRPALESTLTVVHAPCTCSGQMGECRRLTQTVASDVSR